MDKEAPGYRKSDQPSGRLPRVPGTKHSIRNSLLLTSTGVPSLDLVLGGGIAVGTVVLIEEDAFANYSDVLCRYFLAEGVVWKHGLFLANLNRTPNSILESVPRAVSDVEDRHSDSGTVSNSSEALKIAWQYQHLPTAPPTSTSVGGHFDLSQAADPESVAATKCRTFGLTDVSNDGTSAYNTLLKSVVHAASDPAFSTSAPPPSDGTGCSSRVLRVLLQSLGSPLWQSNQPLATELCCFLYRLRALMRHMLGVALVTVPNHVIQNPVTAFRLEHMCDTVLSMESFEGSAKKTNPLFKDYQGLLRIIKLPCLNSMTAHRPMSREFGFKLRRRKFTIETLHLPPALSETSGRGREEFEERSGCGSGGGHNAHLDF